MTSYEAEALSCDATILPAVVGRVDHVDLDHLVQVFLGTRDSRPSGRLPRRRRTCSATPLLATAAEVLSGPGGLAAALRAVQAGQPFTTTSLPLDVGEAVEAIPGYLRRAVILRDKHCRFPGCYQPPDVCQVHHLVHRNRGGPTALPNLALLCRCHHLIVVHRWGWTITMHPDGTSTATSPSGRTLHSHGPPAQAAQDRCQHAGVG